MEDEWFLTIAEELPCGVAKFRYNNKFQLLTANRIFFEMMGYTQAEYHNLFDMYFGISVNQEEVKPIQALMKEQLLKGDKIKFKYRHIMPDQSIKWIVLHAKKMSQRKDGIIFQGIFTDLNDDKKIQTIAEFGTKQLNRHSKIDSFTGFYNKSAMQEIIQEYLETTGKNLRHACMLIDIDNFKQINDEVGHLFGDAVLLDLSAELKKEFIDTEIIGRVGGDDFLVFFKDIQSMQQIEEKAKMVGNIFRHVYSGENQLQRIFCNIGIAFFPEHGNDYQKLFANANKALNEAKSLKQNAFKFYDEKIEHSVYSNQYNSVDSLSDTAAYSNKLVDYNKKSYMLGLINIFEILFETKDLRSGINMVLSMIGKHFDVSRVYIFENDPWDASMNLTYEWCNKSVESRIKKHDKIRFYGIAKERLFYIEDLRVIEEKHSLSGAHKLRAYWKACGIKALLQYGFSENDDFKGFIGFDECRRTRKWTQEEIDSLMIVAKFIASYLVKMRAQEEIEKLAYTDALTGMWNLNKFKLNAAKIIDKINHNKAGAYVMICFDIKKFRYINDMFGFEVGDEILKYIAKQLKEMSTPDRMFTRAEADKFLILTRYIDKETLIQWLKSLHRKIQYYTSTKTGCYKLVFSCGIYLLKADGSSIHTVIDRADLARRKTREGHETSLVFYNDRFLQTLLREKALEDMAEEALAQREFIVYYQPKIELATGKIRGAEALVRWISPTKGFMSPGEFIPVFEKNGFIAKLDFYVFETVYASLRKWLDQGRKIVPISVNLSRVYLTDPTFIAILVELSKRYHVPTRYIELELTESVFTEKISDIINLMKKLRNFGFAISIDDFGSGYSSLKLLRDLPVDYLKLDKEFLDNGAENIREKIIIQHVIQMAKMLGMKVVSEGVETAKQAAFLKACSCDLAQGYLYAKPMPIDAFEKLMWK